jgi:hypothetical protein
MKYLTILVALAIVWAMPAPAAAYVGPGAGLSLLGAVWGMIAAIGTAIAFTIAWPVRRLLRVWRERDDGRAHGPERTEAPQA